MNYDVAGSTPLPVENDGVLNITINLNPNLLANSSYEFIAATVYHEAFHAIIHYFDSNNWFFQSNTTPSDQHLMMFTSSLDRITNGLTAVFPSLSATEAKSLMLKWLLTPQNQLDENTVNQILSTADITRDQVTALSNNFSKYGLLGNRCPQ